MLVDEVTLKIKGGDGGSGVSSYKNALMEKGPTGGDGGRGGDVYLQGVSDLTALRQFRHEKRFAAEKGGDGSNRNQDGRSGRDLILKVPVGTVATNDDLKENYEVTFVGEKVLIAHGAMGGYGNYHFRSSTNITPTLATPGHKAREFTFVFELKLIADIGLIGLPNAGKSSLLNELTAAQSRVANYPFTTLEPHLGAYYDLILADIPGLIEGASGGKGLGHKFLRHVSRCKGIFHLLAADSADMPADYKVIRKELKDYDPGLLKKPEYLLVSKSDTVAPKERAAVLKAAKKLNKNAQLFSVYDIESLGQVKKILSLIADQKLKTKAREVPLIESGQ